MNIAIAGDFCEHHRMDFSSNPNLEPIFGDIKRALCQSDIRIVNFEFPIVDEIVTPNSIKKCGPNLSGHKESIDAIKYCGFNVCTLANNHILDQGEECCLNTAYLLEKNGIDTVGIGENLHDASKILFIEENGERVAIINCCEHEFSIATESSAGANPINPIQLYYTICDARSHADYVLVIIHGGIENYQLPTLRMKELYRFLICVGADAVVNHHQHCYSGFEIYKGKPIFYGLGNFYFDWNGRRDSLWNQGYIVQINFSKHTEPTFELIPYCQCNETPSITLVEKDDNCLMSRIKTLNEIILDDVRLLEEYRTYANNTSKGYKCAIQPYSGRLLTFLFCRRLIPSLLSSKKIITLLNYISCESHRERLLNALNDGK